MASCLMKLFDKDRRCYLGSPCPHRTLIQREGDIPPAPARLAVLDKLNADIAKLKKSVLDTQDNFLRRRHNYKRNRKYPISKCRLLLYNLPSLPRSKNILQIHGFLFAMPIKFGIIGLSTKDNSWTSAAHIVPLRTRPSLSANFTLTALATSTPTTAAAAAKKWGLPFEKAYSSAADIAADVDVDLVVVGVKVSLHKELILPALKEGKDVFVEWPLANGIDEAQELVEAAKEGGSRTIVGLQARCSPALLKVCIDVVDLLRRNAEFT